MVQKEFKNILITGGAGYIGTSLVDLLLKNNFNVRVLDSLRVGGEPLLPFFADKCFEFQKADVRNQESVNRAIKGIDAVVHLAAIVGYPACQKEPELSFDININGTKAVVEAAQGRVPVFFASTGSVYGEIKEKTCVENSPLNPLTEYAKQKAEAEKIVQSNKEFVIYRFATAFGSHYRIRWDTLPNDFTIQAIRQKKLVVYEKNAVRSFMHVRDAARAFLFALQNYQKMKGQIYNVGDERLNFTKEQLAQLLKDKVDYSLQFAEIGKDPDRRDYILSYDKIKKLGFKTDVSFEQGLDELVKLSVIFVD